MSKNQNPAAAAMGPPPAKRRRKMGSLKMAFIGVATTTAAAAAAIVYTRGTLALVASILALGLGLGIGYKFGVSPLRKRQMRVWSTAGAVYLDYKCAQKMETVLGWVGKDADAIWEAAHNRCAGRVHATIVALEGLWVKAGQYMSTRADVMPDAYLRTLRTLQDTLPPRPVSEVRATIERSMGKRVSEIFTEFTDAALGTASIAQVHRATYEGHDVVVKVRHRGVEERIMGDLNDLEALVRLVARLEPKYDLQPIVSEWVVEVPHELNFKREAKNTREVALNLRAYGWEKDWAELPLEGTRAREAWDAVRCECDMPRIYFASTEVLILEFVEGMRLLNGNDEINDGEDLREAGIDCEKFVRDVTRAYAHQIFIDGFYNCDPHPGNFLVKRPEDCSPMCTGGRAVLLDFGLTKRLTAREKSALARMLIAGKDEDFAGLLSCLEDMGVKFNIDMPEEAMRLVRFIFRRTKTKDEFKKELVDERKHWEDQKEKQESLGRKPIDGFPSTLVFFSRVFLLLRGTAIRFNVTVDYLSEMRPFALAACSLDGPRGEDLRREARLVQGGPALSAAEGRVRELIHALLDGDWRHGGVQVAVYHHGVLLVDSCAGIMGDRDPRPLTTSSLVNMFSVTKLVTATIAHILVARGQLSFSTVIADIWPEFARRGKGKITVADILTHRAGLQNALRGELAKDPLLYFDWDRTLALLADAEPTSAPGTATEYHYLSYGWLVGAVCEKASGKRFAELVRELVGKPLGVEDEMFVGIPSDLDHTRLTTLSLVESDLHEMASGMVQGGAVPDALSEALLPGAGGAPGAITAREPAGAEELVASVAGRLDGGDEGTEMEAKAQRLVRLAKSATLGFNMLNVRRGCQPAANGHFTARAIAKLLASLCSPGENGLPSLFPEGFPAADAARGCGRYAGLTLGGERFGLGFARMRSEDRPGDGGCAVGHWGLGGSVGMADPSTGIAVAVSTTALSTRPVVTKAIVRRVYEALGCPPSSVPHDFDDEISQEESNVVKSVLDRMTNE